MKNIKDKIPNEAFLIGNMLNNAGFDSYLTGGCLRDILMDKTPSGWDIVTNAPINIIINTFNHSDNLCVINDEKLLSHGAVIIRFDNNVRYNVSTFKTVYRKPISEETQPVLTLDTDLGHRDFRFNAMAFQLNNEKADVYDPYNGMEDIKNMVINTVDRPDKTFDNDCTRVIRMCRFCSQYKFEIKDKSLIEAAKRNTRFLANINPLKIKKDIIAILSSDKPSVGFKVMRETAGLRRVIPDFDMCFACSQDNPNHIFNVGEHITKALDYLASKTTDINLRWAILFHDIAKPKCKSRSTEDGYEHFYNHAKMSANIAEEYLNSFHLNSEDIKIILAWIIYHDTPVSSQKFANKLYNKYGEEWCRGLILIKKADVYAQSQSFQYKEKMAAITLAEMYFNKAKEMQSAPKISDLNISGSDIISLGIPAGPKIGEILRFLLDQVVDCSIDNNKEILIETIKENFMAL